MSQDTKIFVKCTKEHALDVMQDLMDALQALVHERNKAAKVNVFQIHKMNNDPNYHGPRYTTQVEASCYSTDIFSLEFGCGDDLYRSLKFFPNLKTDYNDICRGHKILVSFGPWGSFMEIAKIVCDVLSKYGDTYYDLNDYDDIDFQKYEGELITDQVRSV